MWFKEEKHEPQQVTGSDDQSGSLGWFSNCAVGLVLIHKNKNKGEVCTQRHNFQLLLKLRKQYYNNNNRKTVADY